MGQEGTCFRCSWKAFEKLMLKQLLKNEKARQHVRGTVDGPTFQAENRICIEFGIENMSRALASKGRI